MENIPKVPRAFSVFCQKVLPLTFDNSLSYLEFLAHVNTKLNETIDALNNQSVYLEQFYKIINDNFEQLKTDLETEIENNKTEIYAAIDDLREDLTEEITANAENILQIQNTLETITAQIETITSGNVSFDVISETGENLTQNILNAECKIFVSSGAEIFTIANSVSLADFISSYNFNLGQTDNFIIVFNNTNLNNVKINGGGLLENPYQINGVDSVSHSFINDYSETSLTIADITPNATYLGSVTSNNYTVDSFSYTLPNTPDNNFTVLQFGQIVFNSIAGGVIDFSNIEKFVNLKDSENNILIPRIEIDETLRYNNGVLGVVPTVQRLTQAEFDAITPDPNLLYIVTAVNGDVNIYVGSVRMAAAYAVGDVSANMTTAGGTVVGDFEILEE